MSRRLPPPPQLPTHLLRMEEAAYALGIHRSTAHAWAKLPPQNPRHLPTVRIGQGARRVDPAELEALKVRLATERINQEATREAFNMGAREIARRFAISPRAAGRILASGDLPIRWDGPKRVARAVDVEEYIRTRAAEAS